MSSESPTPVRPESKAVVQHENPVIAWVKSRGWVVLVHALLIVLAFANIYPFLWMVGTSFKTKNEATTTATDAVPLVKYGLTPERREALLAPFYDEAGNLINLADAEATREAQDASRVLMAEREKEDRANAELNDRQRALLMALRNEDIRIRSVQQTYIPYRIDADTAAANFEYRRPNPNDPRMQILDPQGALRDLGALQDLGYLEPVWLQWRNYALVWSDMNFFMFTATSFVVTSAVVIIVVLMSSMLGFALARLRFPGKMLILMLMLFGSVAPSEAVIIPIFRFIMAAGLLGNLWGMVLWMAGVNIGNAFMMAGFFLTLPKEVEEAAFVDGAGPFKTFFAIALPMAKPIVMTVGLLAFLGSWNNFMVPLLTAQATPEFQPLALAVYMFKNGYEGFWHWINAAATIMVVPVVILFIFLQRYIVNSIAVGAVKG